jgi:hypothetical protein
MNETSDSQIDDLLRRHFTGPVPDDGFSARVARALPARRGPRPWLLPVAALSGSLAAWVTLMPSPLLQQVAREGIDGGFGATTVALGVLLLAVSLLGCGWALEES